MNEGDLAAIWLTLKLSLVTTLLLIVLATPVAWWLARTRSRIKVLLEPLVALPLVLPPTVMGFYLLIAFAPDAWAGQLWQALSGERLAFTFSALVIGSVIYSLPFYIQPLQLAFQNIEKNLLEAAATLGAGPVDRFFSLVIPLSRNGFITAICLAFAHTVGEFGIVLMIGGNLPGETRVLSIALYDHVESMQYTSAHLLAAGMLTFSFTMLLIIYSLNRHFQLRQS